MRNSLTVLFLLIINVNCFAGDGDFYISQQPDKSFISCTSNGVLVSYLNIYKSNTLIKQYMAINSGEFDNYFITNPTICPVSYKESILDLVNFRFSFLEIKDNVIPYVNKYFFQKCIFLMSKVGFRPRITDAFRTSENQLKYKRRGWSGAEISPHIIGLSMDMVDYSASDREIIRNLSEKIGVKYLFHGRGGNRHIHLQDQEIWESLTGVDIPVTSDSLSFSIRNQKDLIDIEIIDSLKENSKMIINYHHNSENYGSIIFIIENVFGEKVAEINSGIFESGEYDVKLRYDFLKKGFYKINIYDNNKFNGQVYCVRY